MKQKNLLRLILAIMCFFISITGYSYSFVMDGIFYNILSDKTSIEVTYRDSNYDTYIGEIVIPSEVSYNGKTYTVTAIGDRAFYKCSSVTSITIPPSISKIGLYAFENASHIQKVNISDLSAWCMIDVDSYYSCPLIYGGTLYLNNTLVTSLDALDSSCTTIGKYAFYGNTNLTNVVLPASITSVQSSAFRGCSNMSYLEVGANVRSMGEGAFKSCSSLRTIKFNDSDETINLGRYESGTIYKYFKDCPLKTVYIGRNITWDHTDMNSEYYDPFTTVTTAIFNVSETSVYSAFRHSLTTAYIGPKCRKFSMRSNNLANLYVFTNDITYAYLSSSKSNIFVIDKNNIPSKISELTCQSINNLVDIQNLQNGATYVYGNTPKFDSNNFVNNVADMALNTSASFLDPSVGFHDLGISLILSNNLWDANFNVPYSYTVTPAPLTVIANDASRKYGTENPELTCSFFGFKNGETKDVLTRMPNVETTATITSNVGTYPIIATGAEAQNYTFNYERGTLTITKADQTIEWNQQFSTVNVGAVIELTATSSADLPIKYTSTDETIAEIFSQGGKQFVEFLKPGNVSIRASQDGNENYNGADRVSKSVKVDLLVSGITLNQNSATLAEGNALQLTATVSPDNASNKTLSWTSANPEIATVDANGKVKALKQGKTTITVKSTDGSDISAQCELTVIKLVEGISINITTATLTEGQSLQLEATVSPELATNKAVEWSSNNESVAIVSQQGKVTAISKGSAIITAKSTDGSNVSAFCNVNVIKLVSNIVLSESEMTLNEGQSATLTAIITPDLANNKTLEWTSSNESVAKVSSQGKVTAISKGTAIITATSTDGSNVSASCTVNVVKLVSGIVLSETEMTLNEGQSAQLTAIVSSDANNKTLAWSSSNETVATVTQDGKVTAKSKGTAIITVKATDGSNVSASCTVNVVKLVSGIVLSESEMTLNEGQSAQLTATVLPDLASNKTLSWSSSNEAIAIVTQEGKITAISKGTAIITATSTDGSNISTSCTVNVVKLVSGIVLSETEMTLNEGQSAQLTAIVSSDANNKTLAWSSSNEAVVTVTQDGKVTAKSKGTAVITVKATDGSNISASCIVNVVKPVSNIILSESEITLNEGESSTLTATVLPDLASNKTLVWSSNKIGVATIDQNGNVTAISRGMAVITAKSTDGSNISASCTVNVVKLVSSIHIDPTTITLKVGEQATISAYALPADATNPTLNWYSDNSTIASVEDGVVTAIKEGSAIIVVETTDGSNINERCRVKVEKRSAIDSVSTDEIKVSVSNGTITILNVPVNQMAQILQTNGTTVKKQISTGEVISYRPANKGVYIIVVGNETFKVVI